MNTDERRSNLPLGNRNKPMRKFPFKHRSLEKVCTFIHRSQEKTKLFYKKKFHVSKPQPLVGKVTSEDSTLWGNDDTTLTAVGFSSDDNLVIDVTKKRLSEFAVVPLPELSDSNSSSSFVNDVDSCKTATQDATEDILCRETFVKDATTSTCTNVTERTTQQESRKQADVVEAVSKLEHLQRHSILGKGTFGQVWLVSVQNENETEDDVKTPYALKIQPKYDLVRSHQAKGAVREMEIMLELNNHPFLLPLVTAFQDEDFIYMLSGYVPGGELDKRVHTEATDGLPESDARFYAAGMLEALSFMHKRQIVYRDLKPENVLIDRQGYPILIDFGFAKHVPDKTYTRCGSPSYMAPEVIKTQLGHDLRADFWSLGCVIHEMITGDKPFVGYATELALYMAICSGYINVHPLLMEHDKDEALDLVQKMLVVNPSERLGSATGTGDVANHPWLQGKIDLGSLRRKCVPAPWVPTIKSNFDASNFEDNLSNLKDITELSYPEINEECQALFSLPIQSQS